MQHKVFENEEIKNIPAVSKKIIEWFNKNKSLDFSFEEELIGGASIDKNKIPITDEVFYKSLESDAVILGACGGPKWDNLEFSKKTLAFSRTTSIFFLSKKAGFQKILIFKKILKKVAV